MRAAGLVPVVVTRAQLDPLKIHIQQLVRVIKRRTIISFGVWLQSLAYIVVIVVVVAVPVAVPVLVG